MSINFSAFEIGRRAIVANQVGIAVTGQNMANVNTPGYSRQRVQLAENAPNGLNRFSVGTGVSVTSVQAFRDRFIESRIQTETGTSGRLTAQRDALTPVESALHGSGNSKIQTALNEFFGSFRDLEANPNSVSLRGIVANKGSNLASAFQGTRSKIDSLRVETDEQLRSTLNDVNDLSSRIGALNDQIRFAESTNANSSGLRDQRNELVNQIASLAGVRSTENSDGTISLTIGEGRSLVTGDKVFTLSAQDSPPLGLATITIDGQPAVFDDGKIRGLQDAITEIGTQIDVLDGLAASVVDRVNTLHTSGTDQNGDPGVNFFSATLPVTAANITINPAITANPRLVVASAIAQPAESGTIAGQIANLLTDQNTSVGSQTGSFSSIYGSLLTDVGEKVRSAETGLETQAAIIAQATAQRDAISGVSIDEEAINLLQYQKSFEAAARFLKVADEMTQTILSLAQ